MRLVKLLKTIELGSERQLLAGSVGHVVRHDGSSSPTVSFPSADGELELSVRECDLVTMGPAENRRTNEDA